MSAAFFTCLAIEKVRSGTELEKRSLLVPALSGISGYGFYLTRCLAEMRNRAELEEFKSQFGNGGL